MEHMELGLFKSLFNRGGYVLDFSNASFDAFTCASIGIAVQKKHGKSKGKSLSTYLDHAKKYDQLKLTGDLIQYYELYLLGNESEEQYKNLYKQCVDILKSYENCDVTVSLSKSEKINHKYIKSLSDRALDDLSNGDFDSVITKARTMLEEVLIYGIEAIEKLPPRTGNITHLLIEFQKEYNMHIDEGMDKRIKRLVDGMYKIIRSIADMRNNASDSHGVGQERINIKEHHAKLYLNTASSLADFLLSVVLNYQSIEK